MGQSSSPIVTKLGLTMYWNNMWDDKLNFSKKLKEDIFINMFLFLIFEGSIYNNNFFFSYKNKYFWSTFIKTNEVFESPYYNIFYFFSKNNSIMLLPHKKIMPKMYYVGRIWILRFQKWLIISMSIYVPQLFKFFGDKKPFQKFFFRRKKKLIKYKRNLFHNQAKVLTDNGNIKDHSFYFFNWYCLNLIKKQINKTHKQNSFNYFY